MDDLELPDWERLLAAERHLQALIPEAVLVGGTAAALHVGHRESLDGDHVLTDLRERFDQVLEELDRPVVILGRLDGILTGIRQLRRARPLETEEIAGLRVPTLDMFYSMPKKDNIKCIFKIFINISYISMNNIKWNRYSITKFYF